MIKALNKLSQIINSSANLIIDERGLLISEQINSDMDKTAIAVMSSLLRGTSTKFIDTLKLTKLNFVTVNTLRGTFLIKEIPIPHLKRNFTLSLFIEKKNHKENGDSNETQKSKKDYLLKLFGIQKIKENGFNKESLKEVDNAIAEIQNIFRQ